MRWWLVDERGIFALESLRCRRNRCFECNECSRAAFTCTTHVMIILIDAGDVEDMAIDGERTAGATATACCRNPQAR